MVVLAVGVQTGGGAQGGVGSGGTGIAQSGGSGHQDDGSGDGEAHPLAQRNVQDGNDRHGAEGGADTHGDQQADQGNHGGGDPLVAAHDGDSGLDQLVDSAGGLHDLGVAASDQHDEADQAHDADAAVKLLVDLVPLNSAANDHDGNAGQSGQSQGVGQDLDHDHAQDGDQGHGVSSGKAVRGGIGSGSVGSDHLVLTGLAIGDEHGDQQADQHAAAQHPVVVGNFADGGLHAVGGHVVGDDAHEDGTEAEGDGDVGGLQAEGQSAGHAAAVDLHLIEHGQHGGDQDGDESDVHGDQVLRQAGHSGQDQQQHRGALAAHDLGQLLGGHVGQTGGGDGGGEGAQQHVSQSGVGVSGEAVAQDAHRVGDGDAAQNSARHSGDDQGHQHVQLEQTQDTKDNDGYQNGIR